MSKNDDPSMAAPEARTRRPMCPRCERPVTVCYCAALTRIDTCSKIVILQHPREHGMPIGTAHMANLCLPEASLHVGLDWDESPALEAACSDPARPPILLYPGPGARDVLAEPPPAPVTLVVVDGTWSQARSIVRNNPALAALPRYAFSAPKPSNYRIRREPDDAYVSTLEAIMHVLGAIEGDAERFEALLAPMNAMVDAQLRAEDNAGGRRAPRRRRRPLRTPFERLPSALQNRYEDLVLVFGDANAWPHGTPERRHGDELIYWVAYRPGSGETLAFVLAPRKPLAPDIPGHSGLSVAALEAGGTPAEFLAAFRDFTRETDVLASWGYHGLRLFQDCGGQLDRPFLDLQRAARDLTNEKPGSLTRFMGKHEIESGPVQLPGRAGRRLAQMAGILATWRCLPGA